MRHAVFGLGILSCALVAAPALAAEHGARPAGRAPSTAIHAPVNRAPTSRPSAQPRPPARLGAPSARPSDFPRGQSVAPPVYRGQPGRSYSGGYAVEPGARGYGHRWHGRRYGTFGWWYPYDDFSPYGIWPYTGFGFYPYLSEPPAEPPANAWYWCQSAEAYWPYVRRCPEGWQVVVPQPSGP